uniref:Peptidase A1 domain-containing protein n=1 Tax=Strongyloides venezuelensis TaxID=75913 RepID=A0A0K0FAM4_STRVS
MITIGGRFLCLGNPVPFHNVILKEADFFTDDILAVGATDKDGYFFLLGVDEEVLPITPYIESTFACCESEKECKPQKERLDIPFGQISIFKNENVFNFGDIETFEITNRHNIYQNYGKEGLGM